MKVERQNVSTSVKILIRFPHPNILRSSSPYELPIDMIPGPGCREQQTLLRINDATRARISATARRSDLRVRSKEMRGRCWRAYVQA